MKQEIIVLGNEYDIEIKHALSKVLASMGAKKTDSNNFLAGSQEIFSEKFKINNRLVEIESETYMGLSLSGPPDLIEEIKNKVNNLVCKK